MTSSGPSGGRREHHRNGELRSGQHQEQWARTTYGADGQQPRACGERPRACQHRRDVPVQPSVRGGLMHQDSSRGVPGGVEAQLAVHVRRQRADVVRLGAANPFDAGRDLVDGGTECDCAGGPERPRPRRARAVSHARTLEAASKPLRDRCCRRSASGQEAAPPPATRRPAERPVTAAAPSTTPARGLYDHAGVVCPARTRS